MNKTILKLKSGFVSSSGKTPEFRAFCRTFKSELKKTLSRLNCLDLDCNNGHFYISGFFNSANGQLWYFNLGDVRGIGQLNLLVHTAQHRKDFTGGANRYARLEGLEENLARIIK